MDKDLWKRIDRLEEIAKKANQEKQEDNSWTNIEQIVNIYYNTANPSMILEMIKKIKEQNEYIQIIEKERNEYYKRFDELAEYLGVFYKTDPGKPETFEVLANEYCKIKERNEFLEKEIDWFAEKLTSFYPNLTSKESWMKICKESINKQNEKV